MIGFYICYTAVLFFAVFCMLISSGTESVVELTLLWGLVGAVCGLEEFVCVPREDRNALSSALESGSISHWKVCSYGVCTGLFATAATLLSWGADSLLDLSNTGAIVFIIILPFAILALAPIFGITLLIIGVKKKMRSS